MNLKSLENLPLLFLKETKIKTPFQMKRSFFGFISSHDI